MHSKEARLGPFEVGQILVHVANGLIPSQIVPRVKKPDGKNTFSLQCIVDAVNKLEADKSWRGERKQGSGAPKKTTTAVDNRIYKMVIKKRGKVKVTVSHLKKMIPELRHLSDSLVQDRLYDAGLRYLRRRRKSLVTKKYKQPRIEYCKWILGRQQRTLDQFCYSDGTVFYLDRDEHEHEEAQAASLGAFVWRHADRSDALYNDCIGTSSYNKAQGYPVRIWGLLSDGFLHVHILDQGEVMNEFHCVL